jgi:hypothetical protein
MVHIHRWLDIDPESMASQRSLSGRQRCADCRATRIWVVNSAASGRGGYWVERVPTPKTGATENN